MVSPIDSWRRGQFPHMALELFIYLLTFILFLFPEFSIRIKDLVEQTFLFRSFLLLINPLLHELFPVDF